MPHAIRNNLLKSLSPADFALLEPYLESLELQVRQSLELAGTPIEHVYFPDRGIASVVATMSKGRQIEVGVIGRDGMTGIAVILGDEDSPNDTFVQVPGSAWRVPVPAIRSAMGASETLRSALLKNAHNFLIQASRTALVNGYSKIEERLARWLLMVHDRVDGDTLELTHEFLATMLGARRPGVTLAIQMLEYRGLIRARRSEITVVDRAGLVRMTGGSYGAEEQRIAGMCG